MKHPKIIPLTIMLCISSWATANAQSVEKSVIAVAGNSYSGSAILADWTIGQPRVNYSSSSIEVTEGFHPIAYTTVPTGAPDVKKAENPFSVTAYPNPVNSMLHINVQQNNAVALNGQVTDLTGKVVITFTIPAGLITQKDLDLSAVSAGAYLVIIGDQGNSRVMKIIKN